MDFFCDASCERGMLVFLIIATVVVVLVVVGVFRLIAGLGRSIGRRIPGGSLARLPRGGPIPIRDAPDPGCEPWGALPEGTSVRVLEYRNGWARVTGVRSTMAGGAGLRADGFEGWIGADEVRRLVARGPRQSV